ncbi:MAG: phosphoribosyltransferase family protein [Flavobacteriaceae bacterium]|nr:phosphoribosyltransferase family protein [Flavobacteriaceae bacterium]
MLNILFPKHCPICCQTLHKSQLLVCVPCRNNLPLTRYHKTGDPTFLDKFYGRLPLKFGTALLHYHKKGYAQRLIHAFKYQGNKSIGKWLSTWLGHELAVLNSDLGIVAVVPVPLHPAKQRQRGFNQAAIIGQGIAQCLGVPLHENVLIQTNYRQAQAKKNRWDRWAKSHGFALNPRSNLPGGHILLVDDVVTTGATLEACGQLLMKTPSIELSCASIAIA